MMEAKNKMGNYLVGIDIGTTGAKCGIFNASGYMHSSGYREYICTYPKPNWVEQDAQMLVDKAFEATKEAIQKSEIDSRKVVAVSLSTQRTSSIFLDEQGIPLKMISWQDNRTTEELTDIQEKMSAEEFYQITGLPLNTTWILTKILWARKNMPEMMKKTHKVVQVQDFMLKSLGADDYYIDTPDAVLYGLWDTDKFQWSKRLLNLFNIDEALLPKVRRPGTKVGVLSERAEEKTGITAGTPIVVGAGDQNAAALGAGIVKPGLASVSIGTGGMSTVIIEKPFRDPTGNACITAHAVYGKWQFEGYQAGAAGVFRWFRDEIAAFEKDQFGDGVYEKLNEMIASTPVGAKGLVFLPYFASATAPKWDPSARGTLIGLTFAHDRACLARAFMEGITMEQKDILGTLDALGFKISLVRAMGGATKSSLWCQMQADMYKLPVETLVVADAALVGAAIAAGVGVGIFNSMEQGVEIMVKTDKIYYPNVENAQRYDEIYEIYQKAYKALHEGGVYKAIAKLQQ